MWSPTNPFSPRTPGREPLVGCRVLPRVSRGRRCRPDRQPFMVYVPFSTRDLYNWKNQSPSFSQNPQGLISLLESLFFTHQPTWDDCQLLLQTLFTSEERERIKAEGRKLVFGPDGQPSTDPGRVETLFPAGRPPWDPNSDRRWEALDRYRQTLPRGIRAAARKPLSLSKVTETVQGPLLILWGIPHPRGAIHRKKYSHAHQA